MAKTLSEYAAMAQEAPKTRDRFERFFTAAQIAEVAHEVNRAYQRINGEEVSPCWPEAPEWQRESALAGVQNLLDQRDGNKIERYDPKDPGEISHNGWMSQKLRAGWTYGPVKDAQKKTHPCLLPYDELPETQKVKDHLFRQVVQTLANCGQLVPHVPFVSEIRIDNTK